MGIRCSWSHSNESKTNLNFGSFEKGSLTFTGIRFQQWDDKSIEYDQVEYIEKIVPLEIPKHRRSQPQSRITAAETTQLRSLWVHCSMLRLTPDPI